MSRLRRLAQTVCQDLHRQNATWTLKKHSFTDMSANRTARKHFLLSLSFSRESSLFINACVCLFVYLFLCVFVSAISSRNIFKDPFLSFLDALIVHFFFFFFFFCLFEVLFFFSFYFF